VSRILATLALTGILAGAAWVFLRTDSVRFRADAVGRWGVYNAESWHRLQRTYPTGRTPAPAAVARAFRHINILQGTNT
jgi:hypothetical protein